MAKHFILLENTRVTTLGKNNYFFQNPCQQIICYTAAELLPALTKIITTQQQKKYIVGYVSYEASLLLQNPDAEIKSAKLTTPLLHFSVFPQREMLDSNEVDLLLQQLSNSEVTENFIYHSQLSFSFAQYQTALSEIKQHLWQGNTYQVNLTGKYHFNFQGDPINFYLQLRKQQRVEYSALLYWPEYQILSLSPELFFKKQATTITARPMKGTAPRSQSIQEDQQQKDFLTQDEKSRAENLMIVDLLRSDVGKIAKTGSIKTPRLFVVESFETLHQMISEITGEVAQDISFAQIVKNLFPCGSITGAPKINTMKIIQTLETEARGVYTGALGYITPENDMCFNVPIRTLVLQGQRGELGVGSGIVADSNPAEEFAEVQLKANFLTQLAPEFSLLESFLYTSDTGYRLLTQHLQRLQNSAQVFNFKFPQAAIISALNDLKNRLHLDCYKIRLLLNKQGDFVIEEKNIAVAAQPFMQIKFATANTDSKNILLQHKTTAKSVRQFYDQYLLDLQQQQEIIFCNELGYVTEGTRTNIFIEKAGKIFTPPVSSGLLSGVMRNQILKEKSVVEKNFYPEEVMAADKIWLTNSVRGLISAALLPATPATLSSRAKARDPENVS